MTRIPCGLILVCSLYAQGFDVASIKPVTHPVGPDYNNQVTLRPASFSAHNVTLKRLIVEAYAIQAPQLSGPKWLAQNEYDIEAKFEPARRTRLPAMLQQLLTERFHLATHRDTKEMIRSALDAARPGQRSWPSPNGGRPATSARSHRPRRRL
jgi:uncharacterized protein (TIGR03435 family)